MVKTVKLDPVLKEMEFQKETMITYLKGCVSVEQAMHIAESQFDKAIQCVKQEGLKNIDVD